MADNKSKRGVPDSKTISLKENYERKYWREKFDISGQALAAAVDKVGKSAAKVEQYVKIKKKIGHY
jgi:hypothetical protein